MNKTLKIGNAQAFWGDQPDAAAQLARQQPDLDYLTLDYLSEVSLSIMAIQKDKQGSSLGYARNFIKVVRSLVPLWKTGRKLRVVTNAGGLNPQACAMACFELLKEEAVSSLKLAVVSGDSVINILQAESENPLFNSLDTGKAVQTIADKLVTANVYFGAKPIAEALANGADIVITGRTADPSLTVGPCAAEFGWRWDDYDRIAGATIAGHLIECGTQATGGISTHWMEIEDPAHIGFPFVEVHEDGSFVVAKPEGTRGVISMETVKEQLLYEIGDPNNYLSPDVTASFLGLQLAPDGMNRIKITGAKGRPPPPNYKVSATYRDGYRVEAFLTLFGQNALDKARRCGEVIIERVKDAGFVLDRHVVECLGGGSVVPGVFPQYKPELIECVLRVAAADHRQEALECLADQIAPMVTSGPQGVTGYSSGRPPIRPVFCYWPCLMPVSNVAPQIEYITR